MECIAHTPHDAPRRNPRPGLTSARADAPAPDRATARDSSGTTAHTGHAARNDDAAILQRGYVSLDAALLRSLRQTRMFSQQDLADECWRRNIRLSLTTIKRAEAGRAVRFRIAREFARCFDMPVAHIANLCPQAVPVDA